MTIFRSSFLTVAIAAAPLPAAAQSAQSIEALILQGGDDAGARLQAMLKPMAQDRTKLERTLGQAGFVRAPRTGDCDLFGFDRKTGAKGRHRTASVTLCGPRIGLVLVGSYFPPAAPDGKSPAVTTPARNR